MKKLIFFILFLISISFVVGDNHGGAPSGGGGGYGCPIGYTQEEVDTLLYESEGDCRNEIRVAIKERAKKSNRQVIFLLAMLLAYFHWKKKRKNNKISGEPFIDGMYLSKPIGGKEFMDFRDGIIPPKPEPKFKETTKPTETKSEPIDENLFYKEI